MPESPQNSGNKQTIVILPRCDHRRSISELPDGVGWRCHDCGVLLDDYDFETVIAFALAEKLMGWVQA